jgi:hypothetical protein
MTPEEQAELSARRAASEIAISKPNEMACGSDRVDAAERAIQRRFIASVFPGGLVEYWQMIEAEVQK